MDLVVGATGLVGRQAALELRKRRRSVRALVRGGAARAEAAALLAAGIEVVAGDLTDRAAVERSCAGIETVISTATSMPHGRDNGLQRVDRDGTLGLVEAAERAGVGRFVYISYSGNIREDSPLETAKRMCERRLLAGKMQSVILRPSYFTDVWLSPALGFDPANARARIYGTGENPVSYISAGNVAEFAAAAAASDEPGPLALELGGPEALSQLQAVRIFEEMGKRKLALEFVPLEALRAQHRAASDPVGETFAALMVAYALGDRIPESRTSAARYGIRLRTVEAYAKGFAGRFSPD
jgi:uncharacterized protein YbjT (DUF2867 family)